MSKINTPYTPSSIRLDWLRGFAGRALASAQRLQTVTSKYDDTKHPRLQTAIDALTAIHDDIDGRQKEAPKKARIPRPRLTDEEKAARVAEKKAAKEAAKGPKAKPAKGLEAKAKKAASAKAPKKKATKKAAA